MSFHLLQRFSVRSTVIVVVLTVLNAGLYLHMMNIQENRGDVVFAPRSNFAEITIKKLHHWNLTEEDLNELSPSKTKETIANVRSQPDNISNPAQLRDMLKQENVQEDCQTVQENSSYNTVAGLNSTSGGIPNIYYGRKILSLKITIIYNAVPKCGSRTLQMMISKIRHSSHKRKNRYKTIQPPYHCSANYSNSSCLMSFYMSMPPYSFVKPHAPYVSLPSNYVMINMVRDPLERFISLFYFRIYGDGGFSGLGAKKQNINDCVESGHEDCDPLHSRSAMSFVCGTQPACKEVSRWTLANAKRNAERYLVIGYLEDIDSMLKVLEVLMPNQLSGLHEMYVKQKKATKRFRTKNKQPLSQKTIDKLRHKLTLHYEFYYYIRDKFDHLKESLGIR